MNADPNVLRVFLSSTAIDMTACRRMVRDTVLQLEHLPVAMESFTALPGTPAEDCKAKAVAADVVVVMVAHRYGYVPSVELGGDGKSSITWLEVLAAKDAGKPVFAFLIDPITAWDQLKEVDRLNNEPKEKREEILRAIDGLNDFKTYLREHCTFDTFRNEDDLARKVATTIANYLRGQYRISDGKARQENGIAVALVGDYKSPDIRAALDLYDERIPESERFEAPDIIRWLREDQEQRLRGVPGPRDYFVVAKKVDDVCGFTLVHYWSSVRLAFIAYLVTQKGISDDRGFVSECLLGKMERLFDQEPNLADCKGFLMEVDDPRYSRSEEDRRGRLARIRLFCMLAGSAGFQLRVLDFNYLQPQVLIPGPEDRGKEEPMLLMFSPRTKEAFAGHLPKSEVEEFLKFIHLHLYPEGFSDVDAENREYREYLQGLLGEQLDRIQDRIALLSFAQFRRRLR